MLTDIKGKTLEEIAGLMELIGERPFRSKQLFSWIYKYGKSDFSEMTDLPAHSREKFNELFRISRIELEKQELSLDGTAKFLWKLEDKQFIESVLIPDDKRLTACVSSQVGCALNCAFCATGKMGLTRNLTAGEIYDQVFEMNQWSMTNRGQHITNIVFMGMGEPLMNLDQVLKSVDLISNPTGVCISSKRITVSTAGVAHKIIELADRAPKLRLAVSVHSAVSEKRNAIMPINKGTGLKELASAIAYHVKTTGNRVTYEYVLFEGFNDGTDDAMALVKLCRLVPSKVNIIMYNPVAGDSFKRASSGSLDRFAQVLVDHHITVMVRQSRGQDINAACGQLAIQN